MTTLVAPERLSQKLIVSGIRFPLTAAFKRLVASKTARVFRHEPRIVRLRVEVAHDATRAPGETYVAKGHLALAGPDLLAVVATDSPRKAIDLLADRLTAALRRHHGQAKSRRRTAHDLHTSPTYA